MSLLSILHEGKASGHPGEKKLWTMALSQGLYWPTMEEDAMRYVRRCLKCQKHGNEIHTSHQSLKPTSTPCPFHTWGMDFIGPITPTPGGAIWILTATEYYTKWVEAIALRHTTGEAVANFIKENIVCRFGIPRRIISNSGTPLINREVKQLLERYNVMHNTSTPYYPKGNGQVEATNKRLLRILSKMVYNNGRNWKEELPMALWAHHTSWSMATVATPFSLVYRKEAVLPVNIIVLVAKVADSCEPLREDELEVLEERRTKEALCHSLYLSQMGGRYEYYVKERKFEVRNLVWRTAPHLRGIVRASKHKFSPNWEGPYLVKPTSQGIIG